MSRKTFDVKWNGRYIRVDAEECATVLNRQINAGKLSQAIEELQRITNEYHFPKYEAEEVKSNVLKYCTEKMLVCDETDGDNADFYEKIYWCFNSFKTGDRKKAKFDFFYVFVQRATLVHRLSREAILPEGFNEMTKNWIRYTVKKYSNKSNKMRNEIDFKALKPILQKEYEDAVEDFFLGKRE